MDSSSIYFLHGRLTRIIILQPGSIELTGFRTNGKIHEMGMSIHAADAMIVSGQLIENKMTKLEYYTHFYPDAKEYQDKTQAYIREDQAKLIAYGKEVNAKCLFYKDIPSSSGVLQHFIFSEKAFLDDERLKLHQKQLLQPYH